VIARVIDPGSRLSAVRLAATHAACDVVGLERFDEEDLYGDLDWLSVHQAEIEDRLFRFQSKETAWGLFLYDVTSGYREGNHNELGAFGYNRYGKRGKRQLWSLGYCAMAGEGLSPSRCLRATPRPQNLYSLGQKGGRALWGQGDHLCRRPGDDQKPTNPSPGGAAVSLHHRHHQAPN
jgi:hypothetical protein